MTSDPPQSDACATDAGFVLAAATGQDQLLQSARRFHALIASGLFTSGVVTMAAIAVAPASGGALLLALTGLALIARRISIRLVKLSLARRRSVSWWQRRLIIIEADLPLERRHFTAFKQDQGSAADLRLDPGALAETLVDYGMTARLYDEFIPRAFQAAWLVVVSTAGVLTLLAR